MSDNDELMKESNTLGLFTYSPPIVKHDDGHDIPKKLDDGNFKVFNDYMKKVYLEKFKTLDSYELKEERYPVE